MAYDSNIRLAVAFAILSALVGIWLPYLTFILAGDPVFNLVWGNIYGLGGFILRSLIGTVPYQYLWLYLVVMVAWSILIFVATLKFTLIGLEKNYRRRYVYALMLFTIVLCIPMSTAYEADLAVHSPYN